MTASCPGTALLALRALLSGAAAWAGMTAGSRGRTAAVATLARIEILGAGAAGLTMASHLAERLNGAKITLVDRCREQPFQPGITLIAAGHRQLGHPIHRIAAIRKRAWYNHLGSFRDWLLTPL